MTAAPGGRKPTRILLVSGLSGAGKSSVLRILEDLGWEVIDNLPLNLLVAAASEQTGVADSLPAALAIGIDSRTRNFTPERLTTIVDRLAKRADLDVSLIFLDSDSDVLLSRYGSTRRRHPLADDRPVADGIDHERQLLSLVRERADDVIDSTDLALPELRHRIENQFALQDGPGFHLSLTSFSYRRGLPRDADLVFDVRFLRNPFYVAALRSGSGLDAAVAEHIAADPGWREFAAKLEALLDTLMPRYHQEGKHYLTIAIGCTGGQHRSVFVAEYLAGRLGGDDRRITIRHRDLDAGA